MLFIGLESQVVRFGRLLQRRVENLLFDVSVQLELSGVPAEVLEIANDEDWQALGQWPRAALGAMKLKAEVPTYKFDVDKVKRLEGNCR